MNLENLLLHPVTKTNLLAFIRQPRHALLLVGPEGIGKATIAQAVARQLDADTQPEYILPDEKGGIRIATIRELYKQTRSKRDKLQIVILKNADTMSSEAENAFLKLLEEPRPGVIFIMTAAHLDALLPTTLSRVQRIEVLPVAQQQLRNFFAVDLAPLPSTVVTQIIFIARGRPAAVKHMATQPELLTDHQHIMQQAKRLLTANHYEQLCSIAKWQDRQTAQTIIEAMLHMAQLQLRNASVQTAKPWVIKCQDLLNALQNLKENRNVKATAMQLFSRW